MFKKLVCKVYLIVLLLVSVSVQSTQVALDNKQCERLSMYPFSFEELKVIPDFTLNPPSFLKASDGIQLAYYSFIPTEPSAIVIFYPGAGLYGNKTYQWLGLSLQNDYSIGCYMIDVRGHGHSAGPRGDAPDAQQVLRDVDTVIEFVKSLHPTTPLYLAGHSAGSGLLINYNNFGNHTDDIEGYIFLAPYLGPNSGTIREHRDPQQSFVKNVRLWVYLVNLIPLNFLQHITAVFFNYPQNLLDEDPLIVTSYTYAMSSAITPYDVRTLFAKIKKPFALYIGKQDEQFLPEKVVEYKNLACDVKDYADAKIIPEAKHLSLLLQTPALIAHWITAREGRKISLGNFSL